MKKYLSFIKIRFINGLQYRAAAWAGVATQFAWGLFTLLMFRAFYKNGQNDFPMSFSELSNYIWLQQAFLAMFMAWFFDNDIFDAIATGNVAYELCRPIDLYTMWFLKNMSVRLSRTVLRCLPILIIAVLLPYPYNITLPADLLAGLMFIVSIFLGFFVLIAFTMLIYISTFYTLSPMGVRILATSVIEFFTGAIVPLPFFPLKIQPVIHALPFASMQNTPFLIYTGYTSGTDIIRSLLLQLGWFVCLVVIGKILIRKALKEVVVQGG